MQLAENDELGDQFVAEIIDVFLGDLSKRVDAIGLQMSAGRRRRNRGEAHTRSRAAAVILAPLRLMELSREVESSAGADKLMACKSAIDAMVAETERVRTALEAYRSSHAPD